MDLQKTYQTYKHCVARVTVSDSDGTLGTGAAFHIGDGYLCTARHVIEGKRIAEVVGEGQDSPVTITDYIYPVDSSVDVAILKTDFSANKSIRFNSEYCADHILIGGHLDDFFSDEFVLSKVLVMGYPIVPRSNNAYLVASEAEVNVIVDRYDVRHPHFILSSIARGGFSGGPVLWSDGTLVGISVQALIQDNKACELGFLSAISVEPLLVLLHTNGIYPGDNSKLVKMLDTDIQEDNIVFCDDPF